MILSLSQKIANFNEQLKDSRQGRSRQCYILIFMDELYIVWRGHCLLFELWVFGDYQ